MKITLAKLRKIVKEEVDRLVRRSAGFGGSAGIAGRQRGTPEMPPPGLGTDESENKEDEEGQEFNQFAVRVAKRTRRAV